MVRLLPSLAILGAAACANVAAGEAGISFLGPSSLAAQERIAFSADRGSGWQAMPVHAGPQDQGKDGRLYDVRLSPGTRLKVEARLVRGAAVIGRVEQSIPIEGDRRYFAHAEVQADDPTIGCMGCSDAVSAPIAGESGARRLWLYWSFNGISAPIIF